MRKKGLFIICLMIIFNLSTLTWVKAQLSTTYYVNASIVSVSCPVIKLNESNITGEIRVFTNRVRNFSNKGEIEAEFDVHYKFREKKYHRFGIGAGLHIGITNEPDALFLLPLSLDIFPLHNMKKFSFVFELSPAITIQGDARLRSLIGLRYRFGNSR